MSAKLLVLYGPPTDPQAFDDYYFGTHLPLVKAVPGLVSAASNDGPVGAPGGPAPYYRVSSYTWSSMAELQDGLASPEGGAAAGDLPNFATGGATLLVFDEQDV